MRNLYNLFHLFIFVQVYIKKSFLKHILLIDNYDSFVFNLYHSLLSLGVNVDVIRNNNNIQNLLKYDAIVISPGPGLPKDAGSLMNILHDIKGKVPVLGICLGMQAICELLGGELYNQSKVKHGVNEIIEIYSSELFVGIKSKINVGLYHSWAVDSSGLYNVTAKSKNKIIMAIENIDYKLYGVQFHPESIMTKDGLQIIKNFIKLI